MWRIEFLHPAMWHDHDIDFARWLHPAIWHVARNRDSEFTKWQHPAMWYVALGWHAIEFAQTSGILHLVSISTTSPQSTCHSAPVYEILSKSDHPQQKKMTLCWFSRWRISAILDFRGPIMGSLKSPCTTSYRSSIDTIAVNCLVFWENRVFCILATDRLTDRQTDRRTDGQHRCTKPLSLSRAVA